MEIFKTNQLEKELQKMRDKVSEREEIFENRSQKWQESEKGEAYEYCTNELDQAACALESLIGEIKEIE